MFKQIATSLFHRRSDATASGDAQALTRGELQDLFRSEFEVHNRSVLEINTRQCTDRRGHAFAA